MNPTPCIINTEKNSKAQVRFFFPAQDDEVLDELPSSAAASAAPNSLAAKKSRERFAINKSYSIEVREIAQGSLPLVDLHISGSRPH